MKKLTKVLEEFDQCREMGKCNMFDGPCLQVLCQIQGFDTLLNFITSNPRTWLTKILNARREQEGD